MAAGVRYLDLGDFLDFHSVDRWHQLTGGTTWVQKRPH